ncbi:cell wall-binding repeat-containing protein [Bacillus sp. EB106-08-02-XG196]|uniref:cell wall-binding repeat-containing protein n=1 Tax=Bacillus sp. EB106-08-02-XG196 TaxID=2737049 RepID=UPI0015C4D511|nr:cell wall-binding repeat-containing protein [Bacillus sp. EB106-08-02-XG196]NWQ41924.1 cell wall-binding repeat-containing protein [Bacillus sp. EB106-08-02-XG196]
MKVVKLTIILLLIIPVSLQGTSPTRAQTRLFNMSYVFFGSPSSYVTQVDKTKGSLNVVSPNYFDITSDGQLDVTWRLQTSFITEMHNRGIKVVPFLANHWNPTAGINGLNNRDSLARNIAAAIQQYNLDGVNVDIEGVGHAYRDAHTDFIRLLRQYIPAHKEVSVAVAANPNGWKTGWHGFYDYKALGAYATYLMIMAYDESWDSPDSPIGPVSSLSFFERSIQYAINQGVAKDRIVAGLPFYGRMWKLDGPTLENRSITGMGLSSTRVDPLVSQFNGKIQFDEKSQSSYATFTIPTGGSAFIGSVKLTEGNYVIWFENEPSIKAKLRLPKQYGIKGTGSWALYHEKPSIWNNYTLWLNETYNSFWVQNGYMALVKNDNVNLRDSPSMSGNVVRTLYKDLNLKVTGPLVNVDNQEWYPVQLSEGTQGYVSSSYVDIFQRFGGKNRFEVAVNVANMGWKDTADTIIVSNYNAFADALTASPIAYKENAPILLTAKDRLTAESKDEISRLKPQKVIIVGGPGSVGEGVVNDLRNMGVTHLERIGGKDRFEVSANLAKRLGPTTRAVVADGMNFPDALSIAPYAARNGIPILLANRDHLPQQTEETLTSIGVQDTIVVGGEASVGKAVYDKIPNPKRISGKDRYEVAANVIRELNLTPDTAFIATGLTFADALTGSVLAAKEGAPLLLTNPKQLPEATKMILVEKNITRHKVLGGSGSVSEQVYQELRP